MNISVFITSYNQKNYLIESIESVLQQTLKPLQIVIVDDSSTDRSQEVIKGYHSRYPRLITPILHARNMGVAQARIDALKAVVGDYVTYVDGDDRFLPEKLENEAKRLRENPQAQIAFSNNYYMDQNGVHFGVWIEKEKPAEGDIFSQTFARDFPKKNLFRMELVNYPSWKSIGFHDPQLSLYEDYEMRIRLTKTLQAVYVDKPLSEIRWHTRGLSKMGLSDHFMAIRYIYNKNKILLDCLNQDQKNYVRSNLSEWIVDAVSKRAHFNNRKPEGLRELRAYAHLLGEIGVKPWNGSFDELMIEYLLLLQELREKNDQLNEFERLIKERETRIENLLNSWSWKITEPLRKARKIMRHE